jgi:beta-phosphoglucomutase-like phosphatase (HAD superfamily)
MKYSQSAEAIKTEYDLNKPEEKKAIRDFEALLENLKNVPLKYPLWVYGEPKEIIPASKFGKREFPESINPRRVRNDIAGLTDAGIVQHLLEVKAISRRHVKKEHPNYGWAVGPDLKAYEDFYQKKRALEELKDKRAYAEQKDEESFDALIEGREKLIKSMKP